MLNRLYILVGTLIILGLVAAFALPSLVNWQQYRGNIEQAASAFFGQQVALRGQADFRLLPSPRFEFVDVQVGADNKPIASAQRMQIDLDLVDFLQDKFTVTQLQLNGANLELEMDENGRVSRLFDPQNDPFASDLEIEKVLFEDSSITFTDKGRRRSEQLSAIFGQARIAGPKGPFSFQGSANFERQNYQVRLSTDALGENDILPLSLSARAADQDAPSDELTKGLSLRGELRLSSERLQFSGALSHRSSPPLSTKQFQVHENGQAPISLLEADISLAGQRLELAELKWWPDQREKINLFEGRANILLGAQSRFELDLSTKSLSLDDAQDTSANLAAAANRLSDLELPSLTMPGRVQLKANRFKVDGVDLRDVELDVQHNKDWLIQQASFALPGGNIGAYIHIPDTVIPSQPREAGKLQPLSGDFALSISKLDALARSFGKTEISPFLIGVEGLYSARIERNGALLVTRNGRLNFGETSGTLDVRYDLARDGNPNIKLHFSTIDSNGVETLLALFPDLQQFDTAQLPFESGQFDLHIDEGKWAGLDIEKLALVAKWAPDKLQIEQLGAQKFGRSNARITANLGKAFAQNQAITFNLEAEDLLGLKFLQDKLKDYALVNQVLKPILALGKMRGQQQGKEQPLVPLKIETGLIGLDFEGVPVSLTLAGEVAGTKIERLQLDLDPLQAANEAPIQVRGTTRLSNPKADDLLAWLGIAPFLGEKSVRLDASFSGDLSDRLTVEGQFSSDDFLISANQFQWQPGLQDTSSDTASYAAGEVRFKFVNSASIVGKLLGSNVPATGMDGTADLNWRPGADGEGYAFALENVAANLNGQTVRGAYGLETKGIARNSKATIMLERSDISDIAMLLFGQDARNRASAVWPVGGLSLLSKADARDVGSFDVQIARLALTDAQYIENAKLQFDLKDGALVLRALSGKLDGGDIELSFTSCCVGGSDTLSVKGQLALERVPLANFVFAPIPSTQKGFVTLSGEFEGVGNSLDALVKSLSGQGQFKFEQLEFVGISPEAFDRAIGLGNIATPELDVVTGQVSEQFDGEITAIDAIDGTFNLTGGVARAERLEIVAGGLKIAGQASVDVHSTKLEGRFDVSKPVPENSGTSYEPVKSALFGASVKPRTALDFSHFAQSLKQIALDAQIKRLEQEQQKREAEAQ